MDKQFWTGPASRQVKLLACLASAALHALVVFVLLPASLHEDEGGAVQRILPALYLYAFDRSPRTPREVRLPIAEPLGTLATDHPERILGDRGRLELPTPRVVEGVLPPGWPDVTLDSVFSVLEVDSQVIRYGWSAAPSYPSSLLDAGIEGEVEAEFVVDTAGRVDLTSVKVLFATAPEFGSSVQQALAEMCFRPAWRGTRRVPQLVLQRFRFLIQRPPLQSDAAS